MTQQFQTRFRLLAIFIVTAVLFLSASVPVMALGAF